MSYCFGNISLDTPMVNLGGSIGFYRNPSSIVIINQVLFIVKTCTVATVTQLIKALLTTKCKQLSISQNF